MAPDTAQKTANVVPGVTAPLTTIRVPYLYGIMKILERNTPKRHSHGGEQGESDECDSECCKISTTEPPVHTLHQMRRVPEIVSLFVNIRTTNLSISLSCPLNETTVLIPFITSSAVLPASPYAFCSRGVTFDIILYEKKIGPRKQGVQESMTRVICQLEVKKHETSPRMV